MDLSSENDYQEQIELQSFRGKDSGENNLK